MPGLALNVYGHGGRPLLGRVDLTIPGLPITESSAALNRFGVVEADCDVVLKVEASAEAITKVDAGGGVRAKVEAGGSLV